MDLKPILEAPPAIHLHLLTVVPAFLLGAWLIVLSRKGGAAHRTLGYAYMALVIVTAIDALMIHRLMPGAPLGLSPIHLLIPLTLFGVVGGWIRARRHDVARHRRAMLGVFVGGMLVAGGFTLLPGRILHAVFFGG